MVGGVDTELMGASCKGAECYKYSILQDFVHMVFCNCFLPLLCVDFLTRPFIVIGAERNGNSAALSFDYRSCSVRRKQCSVSLPYSAFLELFSDMVSCCRVLCEYHDAGGIHIQSVN